MVRIDGAYLLMPIVRNLCTYYELPLQLSQWFLTSSNTLFFQLVFKPFSVPARRGLDFYSVHSEDYCRAASLLQVPGRSSVYESVRMMPITTTATTATYYATVGRW